MHLTQCISVNLRSYQLIQTKSTNCLCAYTDKSNNERKIIPQLWTPSFTPGKNFGVGDLILLYWYNYIDLKVIKSSDISVISGVVYDLGFCPRHACMAWIMRGRWGIPPHCRQQGHSPFLVSPSLTLCTFAGHLGYIWTQNQDRHSWSRTQGQPQVASSSGVHYPDGKHHDPDPSCPERCSRGRTKSCLPWTSPWTAAKLPTLLSPYKPCQALAELYKPIVSSLKPCCYAQWQQWQDQVVTHHWPWEQGSAVDAQPETSNLTFPIFNICPTFTASCVPANAFIPLLWHKPCFYTKGNTASWFCTLTFSNSDSNARQNF